MEQTADATFGAVPGRAGIQSAREIVTIQMG
jgi:hypothetical protein